MVVGSLDIAPEECLETEIEFPLPMITVSRFGGDDMKDIYVVSGSDGTGSTRCRIGVPFAMDVPGLKITPARVRVPSESDRDVMSQLHLQAEGEVATLTIDRVEKRNALSLEMWNRIPGIIAEIEKSASVRVLIIRGVDSSVLRPAWISTSSAA